MHFLVNVEWYIIVFLSTSELIISLIQWIIWSFFRKKPQQLTNLHFKFEYKKVFFNTSLMFFLVRAITSRNAQGMQFKLKLEEQIITQTSACWNFYWAVALRLVQSLPLTYIPILNCFVFYVSLKSSAVNNPRKRKKQVFFTKPGNKGTVE